MARSTPDLRHTVTTASSTRTTIAALAVAAAVVFTTAACGDSNILADSPGSIAGEELPADELATFTVEGTVATMAGTISTSTPNAVRTLLDDHPDVTTIVMTDVPGSANDDANIEASRLIRDAGITTHANSDSVLASGGVDFYLAGLERTFDPGAQFGVHSWGGEVEGANVPPDDPQHQLYLDYYADMGIDADFYWFTLDAAPASGIHWMSQAELERYGFAS